MMNLTSQLSQSLTSWVMDEVKTSASFIMGSIHHHIISSYWPASRTADIKYVLALIWNWMISSQRFQLSVMALLVTVFVCISFYPILIVAMRYPLRKYARIEFNDFKISLLEISFTFTNVEILPLECPIINDIFGALFPSAVVGPYEESDEYPKSKISIDTMKVSLRTRAIFDAYKNDNTGKAISKWASRICCILFQRPIMKIKLAGVTLTVNKCYIAPPPPQEFQTKRKHLLPTAVPKIPTFDQDLLMSALKEDELRDADGITFLIERWIRHTVQTTERSGQSTNPANGRTDDEKMNAHLHFFARMLLPSILIELEHAFVTMSGADSVYVKEARKKNNKSLRETNLDLATLPQHRRALTVVGADEISISFSESACNLSLCFSGLQVKIGSPVPVAMTATKRLNSSVVTYGWHTLVSPFDVVLELKGLLDLAVWAVNYDHHWATRTLGLHLSASVISVSLSPRHLHTLLLHLDDFIDPLSPYNKWYEWLSSRYQQTLGVDESEKMVYCKNYARIRGAALHEDFDSKVEDEKPLTASQMKEVESRMTRHEIIAMRCAAMKNDWRIPEGTSNGDGDLDELDTFLRSSRSQINESHATSLSVESPFQRLHQTPLHALVALTKEQFSFLAPSISLECSIEKLQFQFSDEAVFMDVPKERQNQALVASMLTLDNPSLLVMYTNPLYQSRLAPSSEVSVEHRPLLQLSTRAYGIQWDVVDTKIAHTRDLPTFSNGLPVGIIYKKHHARSSKEVVRAEISIAVAASKQHCLRITLDLQESDLVLIINPRPILSVIQIFLDLSDIPVQEDPESNMRATESAGIVTTSVRLSMDNTSILFITDKEEILSAILPLDLDEVRVKLASVGMSGDMSISTAPITLCAGQITSCQAFDWTNIPLKPIMILDGARLRASGEGKQPPLDSFDPGTILVEMDIGAEVLTLNASPSTLVALLGCLTTLEPFMKFLMGDAEEEERIRLEHRQKEAEQEKACLSYRRDALRQIFNMVDVNESGTLQEDEIERVVLMLFTDEALTADELKRERDYLVSIIDSAHTNQVTYWEADSILFQMSQGIDDTNLTPKIGNTGVDYLDDFQEKTSFLSAPQMRKLLYFDDLREYASMHEVYRISGFTNQSWFPAPSLWRSGSGIDLFWDTYRSSTGCSSDSLNGQHIFTVQRKLVRSLRNYLFAKFCWKTLVQPRLHASCDAGEEINGSPLTGWLLDSDSKARITSGVIHRLLRLVEQMSEVTREAQEEQLRDTHYDVAITAAIDSAILRFGSSQSRTPPLVEVEFSHANVAAQTLLSSLTGWFVPEIKFAELNDEVVVHEQNDKADGDGNELLFRSTFSVHYLNCKHDHMECLVEPYPCFGKVAYKTFFQETLLYYGEDPETSTFTVHINAPRFLSVNALPAFFETVSMLIKISSQLDPETHVLDKDIELFDRLWCTHDPSKGSLSRGKAVEVLKTVAQARWKDDVEVQQLQMEDDAGIYDTRDNENGLVPYRRAKQALIGNSPARCSYFAGCQEIQLINCVGKGLQVALVGSDSYQTVEAGNAAAISLNNISTTSTQTTLSLSLEKYKLMNGVVVSPYQSIMLPLVRQRKNPGLKGRKQLRASGFSPHLTVVPKADHLDSITLLVRPCVTVTADTPIRIRIVRLPKALGYLRRKGKIDITKKHLSAALKRLVVGAAITYEKDSISEGAEAPLPLNILDSSHNHALLIQDLKKKTWRDPVLLTKDFLFNPTSIREIDRCHALSGICVQKERLNVCLHSNKHRTGNDVLKNIAKNTAWDTTIKVMPFFLLINSMPFPIQAKVWQYPQKEDDATWRDPSLLAAITDEMNGESESSDDDLSSTLPSFKGSVSNPDQFHQQGGSGEDGHFSTHTIQRGETLRLSGINLRQVLYLQVSQRVQVSGETDGSDFMWSTPALIKLPKLRTGVNPKGNFSLTKRPLVMGPDCDCIIDVSIEGETRVPVCNLYSPYWIMNKTGSRLEYKVGAKFQPGIPINSSRRRQRYLDSGNGGLPIMMHCANTEKELSVIPVERPNEAVASTWWDTEANGKLVLKSNAIKCNSGRLVDWSDCIELDAAGTSGSLSCGQFVFSVSIESLAGAFYRTKLVTFGPRFIVKNLLHIPITVIPLYGSLADVKRKANRNQQSFSDTISLGVNESTILYNFKDISSTPLEKACRWACFIVNASRGKGGAGKWHLIPIDEMGSTWFGEHDGFNETMCGIVEARVHGNEGAIVASITHASHAPFRIENRSNDQHLLLVQDADDAVAFELPPMHSCGYTWDNPWGKKELRVVVLPKALDKKKGREQYRLFGRHSRCFKLKKVGTKKPLPCPISDGIDDEIYLHLSTHLRISAGTKILSFNDSPWLIDQLELGLLRKGGDYKSAQCLINIAGLSLYILDSFPREIIAILVRDVQIYKPMGSIEATAKVRLFQIDAMLPNCRYPCIIQPKSIGVDRRGHIESNLMKEAQPASVDESECFWMHTNDDQPVFEAIFSYVPQSNMTYVPSIEIYVCPMKIQLDVPYILRVVGMIINAVSKHQDRSTNTNHITTTHANAQLKYITYGQMKARQTYLESLYIAPVYFEMEINIKPDEELDGSSEAAGEAALSLNAIARSTNSAAVSGILQWIVGVGANFAHVSPTFRYASIQDTDRYTDIVELARDLAISYIVSSIKQSYKVIFSMHLLGDPSLLAHQYRTGVSDLVFRTRDEIAAGGKEGVGRGLASFSEHAIGGSFFALGRMAGGFATTLDSMITNETTSKHLKPLLATDNRKRPNHAVEGLAKGTLFLGKSLLYGSAGLIGNPYRGAKGSSSVTGSMAGFGKGFFTGCVGAGLSPFVGLLGLFANTFDGIGSTAKYLEMGAIEARARPSRSVSWGSPMSENGLSYMRAIGIRIHSVQYQKIRKCISKREDVDRNDDYHTSKERKRIRAAEDRRKNPPSKVVTVLYNKEKRNYITTSVKPKLLTDNPGKQGGLSQDCYAVCFEETIILQAADLQLSDEVVIQFRNNKVLSSPRSKPSGECTLTVGDMYTSIVLLYKEQLNNIELKLGQEVFKNTITSDTQNASSVTSRGSQKKSLIIPAPQEYSLFRPAKGKKPPPMDNIFDAITEEMDLIKKKEADALDSDSVLSNGSDSFLGEVGRKAKAVDFQQMPKSNERLFGSISLSFFPVL